MATSRRAVAADQANVPALLSLALGMLSVVVVLWVSVPIGAIMAAAGLVLGYSGIVWARRRRGGGRTLAIAGIVFSVITIALVLYANFLAG